MAFQAKQAEKHSIKTGGHALPSAPKPRGAAKPPRAQPQAKKRPALVLDDDAAERPRKQQVAPPAPKAKKKKRLPSLDEAGDDLALWFSLAHEICVPALSLLERTGAVEGVSFMRCASAVDGAKACLGDAKPTNGVGPQVLCVAHNTDRAVDLVKQMHAGLNVHVAKLFARHVKLDEQAAFLKANRVGVAVGTPNRLLALVTGGHLDLTRLRAVVLDVTPDVKTFCLLTMPGVSADFFALWEHVRRPGLCAALLCDERE